MGGTGARRTPRLAGTYADELNAYPAPTAEYAAKVSRARDAAAAAGGDPEELLISSSGVIVAADTAAGYRARLRELAAQRGVDPGQLEQDARLRNAPGGTWQQVRDILGQMESAGVRRFDLQGRFNREETAHTLTQLGG